MGCRVVWIFSENKPPDSPNLINLEKQAYNELRNNGTGSRSKFSIGYLESEIFGLNLSTELLTRWAGSTSKTLFVSSAERLGLVWSLQSNNSRSLQVFFFRVFRSSFVSLVWYLKKQATKAAKNPSMYRFVW